MFAESILKSILYYVFRTLVVMLIGFILASRPNTPAAQDVKAYTVNRAVGTITLDGKLDDAAWKNAPEAVFTETNTGKPVPLKSTVRVLWDDTNIYFGFYCEDPDAWATLDKFDDPLWGEEVVEVFIDPENKCHTYYELEVNPIGTAVDLFIINQGREHDGRFTGWKEWNCRNLKAAAYTEGDGRKEGTKDKYWTVELAIPFEQIWTADNRPPKDGDMWRINCYRIERGDSKNKDDDWYAAFNPTKRGSFHTPWEFGKFTFKK
ncbi:carbohydrate-binding family 9-like protein [bacterium]|nr:carbohydrate-binding family 9-like protein [bacterium]